MTQAEFAEKLNISRSTVAMWKKGCSTPRFSLIPKIVAVLNVSSEEVLNCFIDDNDCAIAQN